MEYRAPWPSKGARQSHICCEGTLSGPLDTDQSLERNSVCDVFALMDTRCGEGTRGCEYTENKLRSVSKKLETEISI